MSVTSIAEFVVVVPARNEEGTIGRCLEALVVAGRASPVPVRVLVVLDGCRDGTVDVCARYPIEALRVDYENVGRARSAGVAQAMRAIRSPAGAVWIANTDADSRVAPDWVVEQLRLADDGADVVLGLADVDTDIPSSARSAYRADYRRRIRPDGSHRHVHGANLGIRASTYVAAGGFPPLANHEDRQLLLRVRAMGNATVISSTEVVVTTSGRPEGRCQEGVAHRLAGLISEPASGRVGSEALGLGQPA